MPRHTSPYSKFYIVSGASAAVPPQSEKFTQQLIKEEEEAMAKYKVSDKHFFYLYEGRWEFYYQWCDILLK